MARHILAGHPKLLYFVFWPPGRILLVHNEICSYHASGRDWYHLFIQLLPDTEISIHQKNQNFYSAFVLCLRLLFLPDFTHYISIPDTE